MVWLMSFVVFSLAMAVLTITSLRQSIRTSAFALLALNAGDRLITELGHQIQIASYLRRLSNVAVSAARRHEPMPPADPNELATAQ
jgi:hypothetical protein